MRPGESDELLSAYLDREVTPAEREQVESQLDASPDTRAELDALAELSLCLRTFDRPEAPPELKASVMQALAGRRIEAVTPPPIKPAVRRSRREWIVTITAVVTTACGLFLAVSSWQPFSASKPSSFAVGMSESTDATLAVRFDDSRGLRRPLAHTETLDGVSTGAVPHFSTLEATGDPQPPRPSSPMSAPISIPREYDDGAMSRRNVAAGAQPSGRAQLSDDHNALEKVALNDFLNTWSATDAPDRYVANIDLQVADVRATADGFQVLLLKNGVTNMPAAEAARAKQAAPGKAIAADAPAAEPLSGAAAWSDESMIAVYVETTTDRVTKSLEELSQKYDVVGIRLQQPLALPRSIEDEVLGTAGKEAKIAEKSESRATTVDDVTQQYLFLQQQMATSLEFAEAEGPVDALMTSNTMNPENQQSSGGNLLVRKSIEPFNRPAPETPALRGMKMTSDNLKENLADNNSRALGASLNYCSEVRLPLVNNFDLAANNELTRNGTTVADPKTNQFSLQNAVTNGFTRNSVPQNQPSNYSGNTAQRYRQINGRDSSPSVRVLVVFQDAPVPAKAKADRGRP